MMRIQCNHCTLNEQCSKTIRLNNSPFIDCKDYKHKLNPETVITLIKLFSDIEGILDNRSSCTHTLSSGSLEPYVVYESELVEDIEKLRLEYLGEYA